MRTRALHCACISFKGVLKFFGPTKASKGGKRCGVALDAANGTHDGMVNGTRYFTCDEGHGCLVKMDKVKIIEEAGLYVSKIPQDPVSMPADSGLAVSLIWSLQLINKIRIASFGTQKASRLGR